MPVSADESNANFLMFSELLCSNGGIIRAPEGAGYLEETISVIIYAATSTANSSEAAVAELKCKMPDAAIPSADTIYNYVMRTRSGRSSPSSGRSIQRFSQ